MGSHAPDHMLYICEYVTAHVVTSKMLPAH